MIQGRVINTLAFLEDRFVRDKAISAFAIVGSYARGETLHDVDCLLISDPTEKNRLCILLNNEFSSTESFINDDSLQCKIDGVVFDFAFLSKNELVQRRKGIQQRRMKAEHRNWCVGYWMPEGFINDILNAKVVFDKSDLLADFTREIEESYSEIIKCLLEEAKREIILKSKLGEQKLYNTLARNDIIAAFMRLINLKENWRLSSFKHISSMIECSKKYSWINQLVETEDEHFQFMCERCLQFIFDE